jgi:hypothetical protein
VTEGDLAALTLKPETMPGITGEVRYRPEFQAAI